MQLGKQTFLLGAVLTELDVYPDCTDGISFGEHVTLTVRQQILILARLAFYCSVGYKTAMRLGQVRLI